MLTREQKDIVDSSGNIKINAVAGSGKTTTLIEYARARPGGKILYLAFNRAVKLEAEKKFAEKGVSNVRIETAHSLAFSRIVKGTDYTIKADSYKTPEIAGILGLDHFDGKHTAYIVATHINAFVAYFCNSDKARVQELDYEAVIGDPAARQFAISFKEEISHQTRLFLDKMNKGEIPIIHDFYLKKFQLSKPALPFDTILFDEGQDASAAMLDIFLCQRATKVIVGDSHQQIYGWRYAVNSLEKVDYPSFDLSASFRFDQDVAQLARSVISWKRHLKIPSALTISGSGKPGRIKTRAVIARTNTGLLVKAIELLIEKKEIASVYFEGRIENYTYANEGASIYDVLNLYNGEKERVRDKMIASMKDMDELEEYIEHTGDAQLRMLVEVVKEYGKKIPGYIKKLKECHLDHDQKDKADMIFSTVHRCKGMEYDEVTLADDFITEAKVQDASSADEGDGTSRLYEEINLLYVAITRAKSVLYVPQHIFPEVEKSGKTLKIIKPVKTSAKGYDLQSAKERNKSAYAPWSSDEDSRLMELFNKGKSPNQLAKIFDRTAGAIVARVKKLNLD
ncbi:3'-5' exonuclease [Flavitalea sp. BT771]|uniref:3'-5' exonuclease n=1 Tax=Flavitalea sp. BT771 TaxID=3063329 RepID=UPI0026E2163B|nr:3'-5' exonuclease [Flavitalea sp. BT771]MDO6435142.1 3'-5' exonuclease [Flavitalea sp. BT771]MDV6224153.1 3'-5' exonuclease [Flavitalea sp. BT771]